MPRSFLVKKYFSTKRPNYSELREHSDLLPEPFLLAELPEAKGDFPVVCLTSGVLWDVCLVSSLQVPVQALLDLSPLSSSPSSSSGEEDESRSSDPPSPQPEIPSRTPQERNSKPASSVDSRTSEASSQPPAFCCKHCPKKYSSLGALKMHIRSHTLPCVCTTCGKAFSRPWLLRGHIRTHTGERPFSCPSCSRAFADRSNLRAHLQTHAQVKKYQCSTCSRTFSRMSLLQKHSTAGCSV